jgi:hypothetical protein
MRGLPAIAAVAWRSSAALSDGSLMTMVPMSLTILG